jgi:hypothetical protein
MLRPAQSTGPSSSDATIARGGRASQIPLARPILTLTDGADGSLLGRAAEPLSKRNYLGHAVPGGIILEHLPSAFLNAKRAAICTRSIRRGESAMSSCRDPHDSDRG